MSQLTNQRVVLAKRPVGRPTADDFRFEQSSVPSPGEGEVLLKIEYLSLDPYMRGRMSDAKSYAEPVAIDATMVGATVGRVIESRHPDYAEGDLVSSHSGWQHYALADGNGLRRLDPQQSPTAALGVLGMPGFTAYSGLLTIGRPRPGETVVVAAASGPVGSAVGQIAKLKGARGGDRRWCREVSPAA